MNEAETRAELIDPALTAAGWGIIEGSRIRREFPISKGRLIGQGKRSQPLTADYILQYKNHNLAVIEAKPKDDYYTQGFEKDGIVSIWVGLKDNTNDSEDLDVLQDLCGVGYYELSNQEANCFEFRRVSLEKLLEDISYSNSFMTEALERAKKKGLTEGLWITVQYDFEYDPSRVKRKIADDPVFLGCFSYVAE